MYPYHIHPWKLTLEQKTPSLEKEKIIFHPPPLYMFHVNFPGCFKGFTMGRCGFFRYQPTLRSIYLRLRSGTLRQHVFLGRTHPSTHRREGMSCEKDAICFFFYKKGAIWAFPKMVGFPNNYRVFLLEMIILGCFGGTTIFRKPHTYIYIYYMELEGLFFGASQNGEYSNSLY